MKNLVFKEWLVRKLVDCYMGPYIIKKVVSTNVVKLKLPTTMRIHLVINISWVIKYQELVRKQKIKKLKLIEVNEKEK